MYGYVYLTTNLINGKKYIGQHKSEIFDTTYKGSGKRLALAINKYGFDNFNCEMLCECVSKEELDEKEAFFIKQHNAVDSKEFYNLVPGGKGKSETGVIYITNGTENKKVHQEELEYYFSIGFYKGGPRQTEETKKKRAEANKGKKHPTAGPNISKALMGKKLSEEHREKLSKAKKGKPFLGKRKSVICVETNMVFDGLCTATKYCGGKTSFTICTSLKTGRTAYGYHWKYVDKINDENTPNSGEIT